MLRVIESNANGTIRNTYVVADENRMYKETEGTAAYIFGRQLTEEERKTLREKAWLEMNGRAFGYCASPVEPATPEQISFKGEVLAALSNCWGTDYPTSSEKIRGWLEAQWHKMVSAENEVKALKADLRRAQHIIINMAAVLYLPEAF